MATRKQRVKQLIDEFDAAAQDWGWQKDQGWIADELEQSESDYKSAKQDLLNYVLARI